MPTHRLLASLALVLLLLAGLLPPFAVHVAAAPPVYDLLIRNGLVVDGTHQLLAASQPDADPFSGQQVFAILTTWKLALPVSSGALI